MIVSWNWLKEYVALDMPAERARAAADDGRAEPRRDDGRRRRSGDRSGSDQQSARLPGPHRRRPRSGRAVRPAAEAAAGRAARERRRRSSELTQRRRVDCPQLCPRYTARVIRGVKVGPSPAWLVAAAGDDRHRGDQQRRRHHELRADGMRPAAARFRSGEARRPRDHRPRGAAGRAVRGDQSQDLRARAGHVRDRRRRAGRRRSAA